MPTPGDWSFILDGHYFCVSDDCEIKFATVLISKLAWDIQRAGINSCQKSFSFNCNLLSLLSIQVLFCVKGGYMFALSWN